MRTFRCSLLLFILALLCVFLTRPVVAQAQNANPDDVWLGTWSVEGDHFRPIFRFKRGEDGDVTAFLTNDKSQKDYPFSSTTIRGDSVFLQLASANARFRGALSEDGPKIEGTWVQGERSASLTFTPVKETAPEARATDPPRPQEPEPPYPYATEDVTFQNEADGSTLAGTLTHPAGEGPFPAVVLLSGSTPSARDYEFGGHKSFLVLADHLTRHGIAVLRYDKRGMGASEGNIGSASFEDFARDAAAAVRFLKNRPQIDAGNVGFVTHSAGGLIAPMVNERFEDAAFLALLMPPSLPGHEVLVEQNVRLRIGADVSTAEVDSTRKVHRRLFDAIRADTDSATAAMRVRSILKNWGFSGNELEKRIEANTMPWWRDFVRYDPRPTLRKVDVPTLAVFGTKDLAVPPEQNAAPLRSALEKSPSEDVTVRVLDGLNHWMQPATTGRPNEISQIETTIAPELLDMLTDWIQTRTSAGE